MKIFASAKPVAQHAGPALVALVFKEARRLPAEFRGLPPATRSLIQQALETEDFKGKSGQVLTLYIPQDEPYRRVILIGLGEQRKFDADTVRRALGTAVQTLAALNVPSFIVPVTGTAKVDARTFGQVAAEGAELGGFQFADYLTKDEAIHFKVLEMTIAAGDRAKARRVEAGIVAGQTIAEAVNTSRRLVMTPGNALFPETLAEEAVKTAKKLEIKTEVLKPEQIKKLKMGGVWDVGKGSAHTPRVIILTYHGNRRKKTTDVCLIGKGVTFDTGGICIKPTARMTEMIGDMMGAATVLAATFGAARLKLPINLVTIVPAAENMPSHTAYRPGDIVTTMSGQTVEVISTDAEGRLILADALTYAERFTPQAIVDVATLTGAAEIALGNQAAALMSNDPALAARLQKAAEISAERIWELPMYEEYAEQIKSDVADMKNSGGRLAGTIIGGWFLRKFVGDNRWAHLDIAAMDWETAGKPYIPKGCTGYGVRLLIQFLTDWK
jgi:leucyl aminopeptidase